MPSATAFILLASLVSVFLAGGPREGGMGIFLAVSGVALMLGRPTTLAPRSLWVIGVLLLAATGSSFLAQSSLGDPGVRNGIPPVPGLILPPSITLDPLTTLSWALLLGLSLMIGQYVLASPPSSSRGMERLALIAVLGCSLYGGMAWYAARTGWSYPFFDKETWTQAFFGFFPNRNHSAGFLLTGAIVSLGLMLRGVTGGRLLPGVIAAFAFAFLTSLLLFNSSSRGGLVFLVAGVLLWIAGLGKQRSRFLIAVTLAMSAVILLLFLASGSGLLERLAGRDPSGAAVAAAPAHEGRHDARILIWEDTFSIISDYPLTGTGLGTYGLVYPYYAEKSLRDQSRALHPESDWLQLCSEAGIPTLVLALLGVTLLLKKIPMLAESSGRSWPVRWAFIAAFLAELLHGLVDVPLHKPELGWWVMILGCIGLSGLGGCGGLGKEGKPAGKIPMALQRMVFLPGGLAMLLIGAFMILSQWGGGLEKIMPLHTPPFAPSAAQQRIVKLFDGGGDPSSAAAAIAEAREMIREYPMAHAISYQLAMMLLFTEQKSDEARTLFQRQQALSPIDPDLPYDQGRALATREPMTTVTFWAEALRRQLALDASPNSAVKRTGELYHRMLASATHNWELYDRLPAIAFNSELRMIWLTQPYCGVNQLAAAAGDAAFMGSLSPRDQGRIIELWWRRGSKQEKQEVEAFLASHSQYEGSVVMTRAAMLAAAGLQEEACGLLVKAYGIPVPSSVGAGVIRPAGNDLPADPLEAARYYLEHGNDVAARRSLNEALRRGNSAQAVLLRASIAMRAKEWDAALRDLSSWVGMNGK
jgi:O-antigen ligase